MPPNPEDYTEHRDPEKCTHFMMYETVSEGTPISPACSSIDILCHWLADNKANAGGGDTATFAEWKEMAVAGWCPSAVLFGGKMMTGVAAASLGKDGK